MPENHDTTQARILMAEMERIFAQPSKRSLKLGEALDVLAKLAGRQNQHVKTHDATPTTEEIVGTLAGFRTIPLRITTGEYASGETLIGIGQFDYAEQDGRPGRAVPVLVTHADVVAKIQRMIDTKSHDGGNSLAIKLVGRFKAVTATDDKTIIQHETTTWQFVAHDADSVGIAGAEVDGTADDDADCNVGGADSPVDTTWTEADLRDVANRCNFDEDHLLPGVPQTLDGWTFKRRGSTPQDMAAEIEAVHESEPGMAPLVVKGIWNTPSEALVAINMADEHQEACRRIGMPGQDATAAAIASVVLGD